MTNSMKLKAVQIWHFLALQEWANSQEEDLTLDAWCDLTSDDFNKFVCTSSMSPNSAKTQQGTKTTKSTDSFKATIKKSPSDYKAFKEDKHWATYRRALLAKAAAHGIKEVFDPNYTIPSSGEERDLYEVKNTFAFSILVDTCLTARSKVCLRRHEDDQDAHAIYMDLMAEYSDGQTAELAIEHLEKDLSMLKLDSTWSRSLISFLDSWNHKVLDLQELRDDPIEEATLRKWLTATIREHPDLYSAIAECKMIERTMKGLGTSTKDKLSYEDFYLLVRDRAKAIDDTSKTTRKTTRQASKTTTNASSNNNNDGLRRSTTTPHQWMKDWSKLINQERRLPKDIYTSLTVLEAQDFFKWKKKHYPSQTTSSTNNSTRSIHSVNSATQETPAPSTPEPGTNIRRVLSQSTTKTKEHISVNGVIYAPVEQAPTTPININGVQYTVRHTKVRYSTSHMASSARKKGSLVDGGANGGLSGNDCRKLSESLLVKADVEGVGGGSIQDVPICTMAAVIESTDGPIVGLFHQYAHQGEGYSIHSANQIRAFGHTVNDTPRSLGGSQSIVTLEGYTIPLAV